MEEKIFKKYSLLKDLNVSRETFSDFEVLISMIKERNEKINLISKKTSDNSTIRERHIIDSAQIIDFVDLNLDTTCDIGTGGGMPGLVIAIMIKNLKRKMKMNLYEKSYHKSLFLLDVSRRLDLDTKVIQEDIFFKKDLISGTIMARAFKPLPKVLDLVYTNFKNYNNLITVSYTHLTLPTILLV